MNTKLISIKRKIITCVSASIIILVVVLTTIMILSNINLTDQILLDTLQPMTKVASQNISANLHLFTNEIKTISENSYFVAKSLSNSEKQKILAEQAEKIEFVWIGIYDLDGKKQVGNDRVPDSIQGELYYDQAVSTANVVIGEPRMQNEILQIPVISPIKGDDGITSYLVGSYKYDLIDDVLSNINLGESGQAFVIDQNGTIIADRDTNNIASKINVFEQYTTEKNKTMFEKILDHEIGSTKQNLNGKNYFVAYSPIPGTNWSMVIDVPRNDFMGGVVNAAFVSLLLSAVIMIVAAAVIISVVQKISASLGIATKRLESFAEGNLKDEVTITNTRDEAWLLTTALSTTINKINHYIGSIETTLGAFSSGDYSIVIPDTFQGDFSVIRQSLIDIAKSLNSMMLQLNESSVSLADNSVVISDLSKDLYDNSNTQNEAIERLKESMETIQSHISQVVDSADQVSEFAGATNNKVEEGNQRMDDLLENMNNINSGMEKIQEISEMIERISAQTRLLSFNASIEAGRAGESGRGFAVVADQIGVLAGETADALKNTAEIIAQTNKVIENGMEAAGKTAESLQSIRETSEKFMSITDTLEQAVSEQKTALDMVNQEVESVRDIAEANLLSVHKTDETANNFMEHANSLKEFVDQVKLFEKES